MPAAVTAFLGLGSNLGDRETNIRKALERLARVPGVEVATVSTLRETAPVGGPAQGAFLNGAARLVTSLPAAALLAVCRELEREAGRDFRLPRNHPRPLDLDLLLYGDEIIDTRELQVPHPRMWERGFVLDPLRELGADLSAHEAVPRPRVVRDVEEFAALSTRWLHGGCVTGLVPTMGALHAGHASLVRAARAECDRVAVTVFVNPLQFGPKEDYARYPRSLEADVELLRREDADAVFVPDAAAMYGSGFCSQVAVGAEAEGMEGAARPGHFSGVVTVVLKLLAIARPARVYFGSKDAQQVAVVRRMLTDLGFPVALRECPIVREPSGLAMSSRNAYLSPEQRAAGAVLYRGLAAARDAFRSGDRDAAALLQAARAVIGSERGVELEYLELRREGDLAPLGPGPVLDPRMLVAARVGHTRLLDNVSLARAEP